MPMLAAALMTRRPTLTSAMRNLSENGTMPKATKAVNMEMIGAK